MGLPNRYSPKRSIGCPCSDGCLNWLRGMVFISRSLDSAANVTDHVYSKDRQNNERSPMGNDDPRALTIKK